MISRMAYTLADGVSALMRCELTQQQTMAMEPMEFREWLAGQVQGLLARNGVKGWPAAQTRPSVPGNDEIQEPSRITDNAARQVLEQAPVDVRAVYGKARRNGAEPGAALERALGMLKAMQEAQAECQLEAVGSA